MEALHKLQSLRAQPLMFAEFAPRIQLNATSMAMRCLQCLRNVFANTNTNRIWRREHCFWANFSTHLPHFRTMFMSLAKEFESIMNDTINPTINRSVLIILIAGIAVSDEHRLKTDSTQMKFFVPTQQ